MKKKLIIVAFIVFPSCSLTDIEPTTAPVVSLAVGNQFVYYESATHLPAFTDWWSKETITETVVIRSERWYRFNTSMVRRADATKVYRLQNDTVSVELDFTLSPGDLLVFDGVRVAVKSVRTKSVFGETEKVFELSSEGLTSDTTIMVTYATRFGRLSSHRQIDNSVTQSQLVAALVEGKVYGDTALLTE